MTDAPWTPDRVVDETLARSLIETRFVDLRPVTIRPFGAGWDNTAYLVNDEWVFRFPRREIAVPLMRTEIRVLPTIASQLPLAIPVPVFAADVSDDERFPWPFAGYRRIAGRVAVTTSLDETTRHAAVGPMAAFLRALHDCDANAARELGAPGDDIRRLDIEVRIRRLDERLSTACDIGLIDDPGRWTDIIDALPPDWEPRRDCVAHGDLDARHVLVDDESVPTGVIDWGDVHAGDPAVDLAFAWIYFDPPARRDFRSAYGQIDDGTWAVARFRALFVAMTVLAYGHSIGDETLVTDSRGILERILAGLEP